MLGYFNNKRVLVVVAHPDDELLGLGATINKLVNDCGVIVRVLILGEGITSRSDERDVSKWENELSKHRKNIHDAKKMIGYQYLSLCDFPDNRFDTISLLDIIKAIEKVKQDFRPEIVFTHHSGDLNIDHRRTFEAVMTAFRPLYKETVETILTFETPSSTEWAASTEPKYFSPNLFFSLSEKNICAKINAMECYEYEKRIYPHPRSSDALKIQAQRWGIAIGCEYAEAFCLIRSVSLL